MTPFKINIPNPCNENWNAMESIGEGRFCGCCDKTVVDFSKMELSEIKLYFKQHQKQKICGHFNTAHTTQQQSLLQRTLLKWHTYAERRFTFPILKPLALTLIGASMSLAGCHPAKTTGEPLPSKNTECNDTSDGKTGEVQNHHQHDSSTTKEGYILGLPAIKAPSDTLHK